MMRRIALLLGISVMMSSCGKAPAEADQLNSSEAISSTAAPAVSSATLPSSRLAAVCGPDFALGDSRYLPKLRDKKQSLIADGYPTDAVALLDRDGACVAAIERAPDSISLKVVFVDGRVSTSEWTPENEQVARSGLLATPATVKAYYKLNVERRFACCGEPASDAQPDWDASLKMNTRLAIRCSAQRGAVVCS